MIFGLAEAAPVALERGDLRGCWSGGGGERSDAGERFDEVGLPGPAGGEVQRPAPSAVGKASGEREEPAAQRAGGPWRRVRQAELRGPAAEVVREARDHRPGAVGAVVPGREVSERLVLEIADDELDLGVLAVL